MAERPSSYREQQACANCAHAFKRWEYDDGHEFFCTFGAPKRPLAMSMAMDYHREPGARREFTDDIGGDEYMAAYEAWDAWSAGRRVSDHGICGEWASRPAAPLGKGEADDA